MDKQFASKERVKAFLGRSISDRVPRNYSGNVRINQTILEHFGREINDALQVDFRGIGAEYVGPRLHEELHERGVCPQWGTRTRWIEHQSGGYWDYCDFPLKDADEETIANWPMPSPDDYDYDGAERAAIDLQHYGLHVGDPGLGDTMNSTGMVFSQEEVLLRLALEDKAMLTYIDRRLAIRVEVTKRLLERVSKYIDFMWIGEDLGCQDRPLISLDMFRQLIRPRLQQFVDLAKHFDLPVMIHSCGSSSWAFNDFIEMGINAVDTLQPEAKEMSPDYLKQTYGDQLAFHGAISTAFLAEATVDEVRETCHRTLSTMMEGGGYAFAPTHMIQDNTPLENVLAMYEACSRYGNY